jgi:penicillin-binding protein 1A
MTGRGLISRDRLREAEKRPIQAVARHKDKMLQAPAVVENVLQELKARSGGLSVEDLLQGRIHVYSTVDARVQQIMNEALERGLENYERRHPRSKGLIQGSVIVLRNRDAGILAEAGGRRFYKGRSASYSDYNRVTQSLRQPGSAMKPLVYLAAFRQGTFTLESMVPDTPIEIPDGGSQSTKWISNYDGQFKGVIPLRKALAESRNAVVIWVSERIGIDNVLQTSRGLGIRTPLKAYASTALGASEVTLLELANAYRTMASGILAEPHVIRRIVLDSGQVIAESEPGGAPVDFDDGVLALIQEGLRGVVRIPGGTAHALDANGFPIAVMGKTGTTNEFRDALFIGSTYGPEGITVAVRIGFDDNRSLGPKETGGKVALPVFREIMFRVYREKILGPVPEFPSGMEQNINAYLRVTAAGSGMIHDPQVPDPGDAYNRFSAAL